MTKYPKFKIVVPKFVNGIRIWTCSVCGKTERWKKGWSCYGTLEDTQFVVCSTPCRGELTKREGLGMYRTEEGVS